MEFQKFNFFELITTYEYSRAKISTNLNLSLYQFEFKNYIVIKEKY